MGKRTIVMVVASAVALTWAASVGPIAPIVLAALIVGASFALVRRVIVQRHGGLATPGAYVGPLAACWLVMALFPMHDFATRSSGAAVTSIGLQPLTELAIFVGSGVLALAVVRKWEPHLAAAQPPVVLMLLPIWVIASATWSQTFPYAVVRGVQMLMPPLVAWATIAIGRVDRACLEAVFETFLRWYVRLVFGLCVLGVVFGPRFVTVTAGNVDRFTWIGAHPGPSGTLISAAVVILLVAPSRILRLPDPVRAGMTVAVLVAMYANHTRTAWVAILVAVALAFVLKGRIRPKMLAVGAPLCGFFAVLAVRYRGAEIGDYILRDRGAENLSTGNGRRELWSIGLRSLDGPFDFIAGHGFGVVRTIFVEEAPWAGDAHNSVLSLLLGVGIVGVVLSLAALTSVGRGIVRSRSWKTSEIGVTMVAIAALVLLIGLTSDTLAEPNFGYVMLNLLGAVAITAPAPGVDDGAGARGPAKPRPRTLDRT